nr:NrfD/PsrC family molybdoenzyme membrane anchor subunit [Myxococcus sp. RHSTA-1-4]
MDRLQRKQDGRNVDSTLGVLAGEGSRQRVKDPESAYPAHGQQVSTLPSRAGPEREEAPSYYGLPAVKEPVWIWSIPAYLYVGGVAGAASVLGLAADMAGGPKLARLGRRCLWVGTVGDMLSAGLLIHDLGRPERFLNMLRVFRPTSPMSIGSWVLAASGGLNTLGLLLGHRRGWAGAVGRGATAGAAVLGMPLAGYTAVLLCNSAVPVWQATHRTLPLFFMSSATAAAGSLLSLLPHGPREERVLRPYRLTGKVAKVLTFAAVERDAARVSEVARPLKEGLPGALWRTSRVCSAAGLLLEVLPGRARWKQVASDVLNTVASLASRFALFHAGKASARNPQATFQGQRQGLGAAEVMGHTVASDGKPLKFPLPVLR